MDINPLKVCSFNCLYCPYGNTTRQILDREEFYPPEEIFKEIEDFIERNKEPDYVWLKGTGEPTLYSGYLKVVKLIKQKYSNVKVGSWLNGSLLDREEVRKDFLTCSFIVVHLDSVNPKEFIKISRHHKDLKLNNILEGIKLFKKNFKGKFGISSIFIGNINTNDKSLEALKDFLLEIKPDLYIVQEFNNEKFQLLSEEIKKKIKNVFNELPFEVIFIL